MIWIVRDGLVEDVIKNWGLKNCNIFNVAETKSENNKTLLSEIYHLLFFT
jgi:hypothetical protein